MLLCSCSDYLDVVPDNVVQYEDLFVSQKMAYNALAKVYSYLPSQGRDNTQYTMGDEWIITSPDIDAERTWVQGAAIMRGEQAASDPLIDIWSGKKYSSAWWALPSLWAGIRHCDLFIENVHLIPDMTAEDKADWIAQAKYMKAYYLFLLMQQYGPIILPKTASPDAPDEDLFLPRNTIDECFTYIVNLIDEAIPDLKERAGINELGQVDKVSAKSMKVRILLYRASPFYNGNSEYYSNFLNAEGQPFFSQTEDKEKWKDVIAAADEALASCAQNGLRLYEYRGQPYAYDTTDFRLNTEKMQKLYDLRMLLVDTWNEEIIWGVVADEGSVSTMHSAAVIKKPDGYGGPGASNSGSGWMAGSYQSMERFYTEHGLPFEDDNTVIQSTLLDIVTTPDENNPAYTAMRGFMQPGVQTIRMYLNREPRFYANLGITGGYYRAHQVRINTMMYADSPGGYYAPLHGTWAPKTGIMVQKIVHPESIYGAGASSLVLYAWPYIRVADLYLMKAEALNEYYGPSQDVYDALNMVRARAGIPKIEDAYTGEFVRDEARNKHFDRDHLRDIILRERGIEFAYESAMRYWDMLRTKRAISEFSVPAWGWNYLGTTASTFFDLQIVQSRKWSITDCLWPIHVKEVSANATLVQNPGW
ncbi:MAG: RagB/SusD family nutrient uptake outer membrane protein [Tannerella sp.]|nr:RagB/SusD family nutrient uptake outer membrane protein [Tannerella sp.]